MAKIRKNRAVIGVDPEFKRMLGNIKKEALKRRGISPSDTALTAELSKKNFDRIAIKILFG